MTELREIVAVEDRSKFDELVYRRDLDSSRIKDPREHDYRHSRVSTCPVSPLKYVACCKVFMVKAAAL